MCYFEHKFEEEAKDVEVESSDEMGMKLGYYRGGGADK